MSVIFTISKNNLSPFSFENKQQQKDKFNEQNGRPQNGMTSKSFGC